MQNLVQPYLLGFKQALPSYSRVPTKEEPFDSTYFANKIIAGNCYPDSCDIISNVEQGTKLCNTYEREKQGGYEIIIPSFSLFLQGSSALNLRVLLINVGYIWISWDSTQALRGNIPQVWCGLCSRGGVRPNTRKIQNW